jgi:hypothetical protein
MKFGGGHKPSPIWMGRKVAETRLSGNPHNEPLWIIRKMARYLAIECVKWRVDSLRGKWRPQMAKKTRTCAYFGIKVSIQQDKSGNQSVEITEHVSDNHDRHSMWCGMPKTVFVMGDNWTYNSEIWFKMAHAGMAKHKAAEYVLKNSKEVFELVFPSYAEGIRAHIQGIVDTNNPKIAAAVKANKKGETKAARSVKVSVTQKSLSDGDASTVLAENLAKIRQTTEHRRKTGTADA